MAGNAGIGASGIGSGERVSEWSPDDVVDRLGRRLTACGKCVSGGQQVRSSQQLGAKMSGKLSDNDRREGMKCCRSAPALRHGRLVRPRCAMSVQETEATLPAGVDLGCQAGDGAESKFGSWFGTSTPDRAVGM